MSEFCVTSLAEGSDSSGPRACPNAYKDDKDSAQAGQGCSWSAKCRY